MGVLDLSVRAPFSHPSKYVMVVRIDNLEPLRSYSASFILQAPFTQRVLQGILAQIILSGEKTTHWNEMALHI